DGSYLYHSRQSGGTDPGRFRHLATDPGCRGTILAGPGDPLQFVATLTPEAAQYVLRFTDRSGAHGLDTSSGNGWLWLWQGGLLWTSDEYSGDAACCAAHHDCATWQLAARGQGMSVHHERVCVSPLVGSSRFALKSGRREHLQGKRGTWPSVLVFP